MAAVLKTVELKGSGGSNPSLSALCKTSQVPHVSAAFVFGGPPVESSLSEGLLVLFFESEGGRTVEAMEAKLLARHSDALDKCLYRIEFQGIQVQLASDLIDHTGIFRSS